MKTPRRLALVALGTAALFTLGIGTAVATHTITTEEITYEDVVTLRHKGKDTVVTFTGTITDTDTLPHETVPGPTTTVTETVTVTETTAPPPPPPPSGNLLRDKPPGYPNYAGYEFVNLANGDLWEDFGTRNVVLNIGDFVGTQGPEIVSSGNVVIIGGRIRVTQTRKVGLALVPKAGGHIYVEGLRIAAMPGITLHDAIVTRAQANGKVTLQNILTGPTGIHPGLDDVGWHSDALQIQGDFAGQGIRAHRITSLVDYTGVMFSEFTVPSFNASHWNFRRVDVNTDTRYKAHTCIYSGNSTTIAGIVLNEFYWDKDPTQSFRGFNPVSLESQAKFGLPPNGDFVTESQVGLGYVSPGYQ